MASPSRVGPSASAPSIASSAMRADGVVRARGLCWKPPGASAYALEKIDLELRRGECALLTGPSGSGKSSLLRALAGLLRDGRGEGVLELARAARPDRLDAGLLLQNPDTQLLCATVGDELRLGLEALGLPDASVEARLREVRDALELSGIERRNVERLSAGQKQRVALGAVLALQPDLLLLDEPTAQLDAAEVARLVELLGVLKRSGHAILIAEHLPGPFRRLADRWLRIENGVLREEFGPPPETESRRWPEVAPGEVVLQLESPELRRRDGEPLLRTLALGVRRGERVHLFGANGAGKTTLLRACAGLEPIERGTLRVLDLVDPLPEQLAGRVGFVAQNPEWQLFEERVDAEVGVALARLGVSRTRRETRVSQALCACEASHLAARSPLALSHGEQPRVALASALAAEPALLLLDEPFAGLDPEQRLRLLEQLCLASKDGAAVIVASHAPLIDPGWATRTIHIEGGRLVEA